ncbi:MAG TPA: NADH:flavin oxidoreductase [Acidimicrobiales bacterium]|nr:NADH:flavin oxidoreductase [Acidimicrobiales bacterium]
MSIELLFEPGQIGPVTLRNRFVRAGTCEGMVDGRGIVTAQFASLLENLARNEVGLIITGHMFVDRRGQYDADQTAIDCDDAIAPLQRTTEAVHRRGGKIFGQIAHAGSQSIIGTNRAIAPSRIPNAMTGREVPPATTEDIEAATEAFAAAARRAVEAGCDGVHIHAANGYLISEFSSPIANRREDEWGGSAARRDRFVLEVVKRVRAVVPSTVALTIKLGLLDMTEGGLGLEESVPRAERIIAAGVDAIEVSCNLMRSYADNIVPYVGVDRRRALGDLLLHRLWSKPPDQAYYRDLCRALRSSLDAPLILAGGLRTAEVMTDIIESGDADFVALARPFIREPDLVRRFQQGRGGSVECTSCNICLMHSGHHPIQCWRKPRTRLVAHGLYRMRGGFRSGIGSGQQPRAPSGDG